MKPFLVSILFFFLQSDKAAYICGSGKTDKYHLKENCRGLSNCQYKIVKTTLTKAKKESKTLCKWED